MTTAFAAQPPAVVSPEIGADKTITFRYFAPAAKQVTVNGELDGKPHPLTMGTHGVWSVTVGPLAPDIYTYAFTVDGAAVLDPRNANTKIGHGFFGAVSVVQVPGDGPQFYDAKPVPHGAVRIRPYESKSLGLSRTVWVCTPPGYDEGKDDPVLYLPHGAGDVESGWVLIGRANLILALDQSGVRPARLVPLRRADEPGGDWSGGQVVPEELRQHGRIEHAVQGTVGGRRKGRHADRAW